MMSKNSSLLVMTILACMIFVGLAQASPLNPFNKRQGAPGSVAYCDLLGGRFTWTNIPGEKCRVTGQFNNGFESADVGEYEFHLEDDEGKVIQSLTKEISKQVSINPPGTSPFQCDFPFSLTSVADVKGLCFVVYHKGKAIGKGVIQKV